MTSTTYSIPRVSTNTLFIFPQPEPKETERWEFERIAEGHGLSHDFGFLTPIDFGKRAVLEYDYYIDHTDPSEKRRIEGAMAQIEPMLDQTIASNKGVSRLKDIFSQGCSRKEGYLYPPITYN